MRLDVDLRRWSLSARLIAYLALTTTAVFCFAGWLLYTQLAHQLWEKDESVLRESMDLQKTFLFAVDLDSPDRRWQSNWEASMGRKRLALRLTSPNGEVTETGKAVAIPPADYPQPRAGGPLKRLELERNGRTVTYMVASRFIQPPSGKRWLLQAAYDVTESEELVSAFARRILEVQSLGLVLAVTLGVWVVRRGLLPLRVMSDVIAGINAQKLDSRIADRAWPSDLRLLSRSFDAMLERLQSAFDQLSRFSADLAHEFRSPMTTLVSAASVTLSRERTISEYQDTLAVVVEEGERLSRMVSSMLFLARADNAQQALSIERLSLKEQLQQLSESYAQVAEDQNIQLATEGEATVEADASLLRSALSNLVANALRYTPPGGRILLSAGADEGGVVISVADNGCGIDAQHLPYVFERFYRVDAARRDGDRTGLGLALVRSIVDLHGGKVYAESTPGLGARFSLWFPDRANPHRL